MNAASSADREAASPPIDVFSDVVCPWCYIGKRRLASALAALPEPAPAVRWHAFQLNPALPPAGVERQSYLEEKFGGAERARDIYARVEAAGREVGIEFDFQRIARQPNTLDAHRLIDWAQRTAPAAADALVEALFRGYFVEGVDIGERANLAALAAATGYDPLAARAWLDSPGGREEVAAANREARRIGIDGVPCFIFNRRLAVSGAQPPAVLLAALAESRAAPAAPLTPPAG